MRRNSPPPSLSGVGGRGRGAAPDVPSGSRRILRTRGFAAFLFALLGVAGLAGFARPAAGQDPVIVSKSWAFTPPNHNEIGNQFRLLFITSDDSTATSTDISDYDTFVQNAVANGHAQIQEHSSKFKVLGSTSSVNATDHTGTTYTSMDKGVPIYWLKTNPGGGAKVAADYEDFYDNTWDNKSNNRNELGAKKAPNTETQNTIKIWTGTNNSGTKSSRPLGNPHRVSYGQLNNNQSRHLLRPLIFDIPSSENHFYGLSPVFEVGVVPTKVTLSVSGGVTEGGAGLSITATASQRNAEGSAVSIPISVRSDSTTADAADYTVASTISIANNATTGTTTLSAPSGDGDELLEQVVVGLDTTATWAANWQWADPDSVIVPITDNDPTSVTLQVTDGTTDEGDMMDTAEIQLTLGRALESGESIGVPLQFAGGALGTNFTLALSGTPAGVALSSNTVTFTGGAGNASTATLTVTAMQDLLGVPETVTVSIPASDSDTPGLTATGLDGGASGSGTGEIMITDDEPPTYVASILSVAPDSFEGSGTGHSDRLITFDVTPSPPAKINVDFCMSGTATYDRDGAEADYEIVDTRGAGWGFRRDDNCSTGGFLMPNNAGPFSIRVYRDDDVEEDETVTLTLTTNSQTANDVIISSTNNTVTYTILNDDYPTLDLSVSDDGEVTEEGGMLTVTATASETLSGSSLSIPLERVAAHSTADETSDYTLSGSPAGTITIADGASSGSITLTTVGNTQDDFSKTLRLAMMSPPDDYEVGAEYVDMVLVDDDSTQVTLSVRAGNNTATEGDATVTAKIDVQPRRNLVAPEVLEAPLQFSGGAPVEDFSLALEGSPAGVALEPTTGVLTFTGPAGNAVVVVTAADDVDGIDERVTVTIPLSSAGSAPKLTTTNMDGGAVGTTVDRLGSNVIMITDDDEAAASFASASASEGEGAGTVDLTVNLAPAPTEDITLTYMLTGTAARGSDYDISGVTGSTGTLSVLTGATSATISVDVTDDIAWEDAETVVLTLQDGTGYVLGSTTVHTLTITDNDTAEASFASATSSVGEAAGTNVTLDVTVNLNPAPPAAITLNYMLSGTAGRIGDYWIDGVTSATGTLTVSPNATSANITVNVRDDMITEASETVLLTLQPGDGYTLGSTRVHTLTITDNDTPAIIVTPSLFEAPEEGPAKTYAIRLGTEPPGTVTVTPVSSDPGAATVSGPLTFDRLDWQTDQTVTVTPVQDNDADNETVMISHTVTGYGSGTSWARVTVAVNDDEISPNVGVTTSALTLDLAEDGAAGSYMIRLNTNPEATVTVTPVLPPNTDALTVSGALTFDGTTWEDPQTVTVTPRQDADWLDNTVMIRHRVSGYAGVPSNVAVGPVTVTVADDDEAPPVASFASASSSTGEGTGIVNVRINLNRAAPSNLTLRYRVGGTATSGEDVTVDNSGSATVPSGSASATVTVAILDDSVTEGVETLELRLQSGTGYQVGAVSVHMIAIDDDDTPSIAASMSSLDLDEGGDPAIYTLALGSQPDRTVTITPVSSDKQAATVSGALRFNGSNWQDPQVVTITPVDDADADHETVTVTHVVTGYGDMTMGPEVEVSVEDAAAAGVRASVRTLSIQENGDPATYTLALRTDPGGAVIVTPSSSDEQAATVSGALTFDSSNWQAPQTVTVTPVNDTNVEDDMVVISHAVTGYAGVAAGPAVHVTVVDATTIISVEEEEKEEIPTAFALEQNYPNPFNPVTTIEFALDKAGYVTLSVYDVLGKQVRLLMDGVRPAARYRVSFDASGLASGTYLYVLRTEQQTAVRTMALLK